MSSVWVELNPDCAARFHFEIGRCGLAFRADCLNPQAEISEKGNISMSNIKEILAEGTRIELAPHLDEWMKGNRFGTVISFVGSDTIKIHMDKDRANRNRHIKLDDLRPAVFEEFELDMEVEVDLFDGLDLI